MKNEVNALINRLFAQAGAFTDVHGVDDDTIKQLLSERLLRLKHGDIYRWSAALEVISGYAQQGLDFDLNNDIIQIGQPLSPTKHYELAHAFQALKPWRKGPFNVQGVLINSEWRSDMKWQRIQSHIDLEQARILDIGCGNGYYALRMIGAKAQSVVGVEPSLLLLFQYLSVVASLPKLPFWLLSIPFESLPENIKAFDYVFSMGVLYHRPKPKEHLHQILQRLRVGGKLVLETLTLPDDYAQEAIHPAPEQRYAQMRNVWEISKQSHILSLLEHTGFKEAKVLHTSFTTPAEQRATSWMQFHSLLHFLAPDNPQRTIEDYPAPQRTLFIAQK